MWEVLGLISNSEEKGDYEKTIVLKTGPDQPVRLSVSHGSSPVRWIGPKDDWIGIGPSEPDGSTIFFFFYNIKDVVLITPNLSLLPEGRRPDEGTNRSTMVKRK